MEDIDRTIEQIIEELKGLRDSVEWNLADRDRVRGTLKNDSSSRVFDPLTVLAFLKTGQFFPEGQSAAAGRLIGLSFDDCTRFVAACDYPFVAGTEPGDLRLQIIAALFGAASSTEPVPTMPKRPLTAR